MESLHTFPRPAQLPTLSQRAINPSGNVLGYKEQKIPKTHGLNIKVSSFSYGKNLEMAAASLSQLSHKAVRDPALCSLPSPPSFTC